MLLIRAEQPGDIAAIRTVNTRVFGQPEEADIVDKLRDNCPGVISLVAVLGDQVVGHILFSPVTIEGSGRTITGMGLAPMAVLPDHQRQGIGSKLIQAGIARLKEQGCPFAIVLGHTDYYPRFGFQRASLHDVQSQWDVPDEAFMILVFNKQAMSGVSGIGRYRGEFNEAM